MRALAAIAGLIAGVAAGQACAADLVAVPASRGTHHHHYHHYASAAVRAPMLLLYDDQPGVYIRPYWAAPWRHRHYFPRTGRKPKVGRRENLAARYYPKPAQSFRRSWSVSSGFVAEWPGGPVFDIDPTPLERPLK
jgi:hypothetical protein